VRIKKFSIKKDKVNIRYESQNKKTGSWDEYSMSCSDAPRPELEKALQDLATDVLEMCELPKEYTKRIKVTGVTFSYGGENEVMGATITSQMKLHKSNCDLNINTPHKASASYTAFDADPKALLTNECIAALEYLCKEIELYISGQRAQTTLFAVL
jgi:hypothetical protein